MTSTTWEKELKEAEKTALVKDNRRKIHFTFKDKSEMVEEYDMSCCQLFVRKWRRPKGMIGQFGDWEFEVGEPMIPLQQAKVMSDGLMESLENPLLVREDNQKAFQFRIRNLPWPKDNYCVALNAADYSIIVSTKNKKYYKKLYLPDLRRLGVAPAPEQLKSSYSNNTLIVQYEKPRAVLEYEQRYRAELLKMKASKDGEVDQCPVS